MTCIAAYVDKEKNIWMGGDSIAYGNYEYNLISQPKVFLTHNMIIGYTSSFRMGQILQYDFDIPKHSPELTDNRYMVSVFIDKIIVDKKAEWMRPLIIAMIFAALLQVALTFLQKRYLRQLKIKLSNLIMKKDN